MCCLRNNTNYEFIYVSQALSVVKNYKSPGSDGLPSEFYSVHFNLVRDILLSVSNLAFVNDRTSESQRLSNVTLLCKDTNNLYHLNNWRPISVCNIDCKILTKCLSHRLSKVLSSVIHEYQTCSVKGRSIFDNEHLLRNICDYIEQNNLKCAYVSLDMLKAFDRAEMGFLHTCLEAYRFGPSFRHWILTIYSDVSPLRSPTVLYLSPSPLPGVFIKAVHYPPCYTCWCLNLYL
jgi:hypothetical protein